MKDLIGAKMEGISSRLDRKLEKRQQGRWDEEERIGNVVQKELEALGIKGRLNISEITINGKEDDEAVVFYNPQSKKMQIRIVKYVGSAPDGKSVKKVLKKFGVV